MVNKYSFVIIWVLIYRIPLIKKFYFFSFSLCIIFLSFNCFWTQEQFEKSHWNEKTQGPIPVFTESKIEILDLTLLPDSGYYYFYSGKDYRDKTISPTNKLLRLYVLGFNITMAWYREPGGCSRPSGAITGKLYPEFFLIRLEEPNDDLKKYNFRLLDNKFGLPCPYHVSFFLPEFDLFTSRVLTEPGLFTSGIEGPACDKDGNIYAVNFEKKGTIGKVTPDGDCSLFIELPEGSVGNGIRFNSKGEMLIADYTQHNILKVDMDTKEISVFAHEPNMNQPNDIAITSTDILFASDPNWKDSTGNLWRIDKEGTVTLLESDMGTTNGVEVSPDNKTLYVNESIQRNIWAYDLSSEGDISNKRLLIKFEDFGLDGMRCDEEGNLYVTRYDKGTVVKVSPQGEILREIILTGKKPSNITFGDPDGKTAYVTLADNGNIETFRVDVKGRE